jgi:hypothetical protein
MAGSTHNSSRNSQAREVLTTVSGLRNLNG